MVNGRENATKIMTADVGESTFSTILPAEITVQALMWTIVILTLVAASVNACTLLGLRHSEDLTWTPRYTLLKNLILSDVLLIITHGPTVIYCLYQRRTLSLGNWCFIQYFVGTVCLFNSVFTITCMALERYLYVCQGIHYLRILTPRRMCGIVSITWLLSVCEAVVSMSLLHLGREQGIHLEGNTTFGLLCEPDTLEHAMGNPRAAAIFRKVSGFSVTMACLVSYSFSYLRMYQEARNAVQPFLQVNRRARKTVLFYCVMLLIQLLPAFVKITSDAIWELEGARAMVPSTFPVFIPSSTAWRLHIALILVIPVPPCINPLIYGLRNREVHQGLPKMIWCKGKCHELSCMDGGNHRRQLRGGHDVPTTIHDLNFVPTTLKNVQTNCDRKNPPG